MSDQSTEIVPSVYTLELSKDRCRSLVYALEVANGKRESIPPGHEKLVSELLIEARSALLS